MEQVNTSVFFRKNMNYADVFQILWNNHLAIPYPQDSVPCGNQLYNLGRGQFVTKASLRLHYQHKQRSPIVRIFDGIPLVCRAFYSDKSKHSVLYCAWLESQPNFIILWERNRDEGICIELLSSRFVEVSIDSLLPTFNRIDIGQNNVSEKENKCESDDLSESFVEFLKTVADNILKEVNVSTLDDDNEYDPFLGDFVSLRRFFLNLRNEFQSMLACRMCRARNMDKVLLTEFKASWEEAIHIVKTHNLDGMIPITEWQIAMWLFVIGCPETVKSCDDFMHVICAEIIQLDNFQEDFFVDVLCNKGFSAMLSKWLFITICDCSDSLDEELQNIAEPVSWNSYLCASNGKLCYTHSHVRDKENGIYDIVKPTEIILTIGNEIGTYDNIVPVQLNLNKGKQWYPRTYAEEVFQYMKKTLVDDSKCFYGHCCSEQSIVKMSKSGISHLCTYENRASCGHGMYFFRIDNTCLSREFEELCQGAYDREEAGRQFQGFIYALTRIFESRKCSALSLAVLFLLVDKNFSEIFDTTKSYLPTVKCSCVRSSEEFTFEDTQVTLNKDQVPTASDVANAVSIMPQDTSDRCEKFNAFAMMSGIVNYNEVHQGILTGNVCDNSCSYKRMPLNTLLNWDASHEYNKWKQFLQVDVGEIRRKRLLFDHDGKLNDCKGYRLSKPSMEYWDVFPTHNVYGTITIPEYIFISSSALNILFSKSTAINVAFINPDESFYSRCDSCHSKEDTISTIDPESAAVGNMNKRHPYWRLRIDCKRKNCLRDNISC